MCGRLACGLQAEEICKCCRYQEPGKDKGTIPEWKHCSNLGKTYKPSYNICPTEVAPVLLSGTHFKSNSRVVAPMVFGVIPNWGSTECKIKYATINCRIETIKTSKLYSTLLKKGQRCVVICNGFFEWHKKSGQSKPYFIHPHQPEGVHIDNPMTWNVQNVMEKDFSGSIQLLKLAALFETNTPSILMEDSVLSFTIITKEASCDTSWLHSRTPVILETNEQLNAWLNYEEVDFSTALQQILQNTSVICVSVSNSVNNGSNKDISCIQHERDSKENSKKKDGSSSKLQEWLKQGKKRANYQTIDGPKEKIEKN